MTSWTKSNIARFAETLDLSFVPSILSGMQEEDKVSDAVGVKNCFRVLRNFAVHESSSFVTQLSKMEGSGYQRLVFQEQDGESITLDMSLFFWWMLIMYKQTGCYEYIAFVKKLYNLLYPEVITKYHTMVPYLVLDCSTEEAFIKTYVAWSTLMYKKFSVPIPINLRDVFIQQLHEENKKVFMKLAFPNTCEFVCSIISGAVDFTVQKNVDFVCEVFAVREG